VVTALVVRAAVEHAQRHGLADAAGEIGGIRLDLDGLLAETVATHTHLGWPAIAEALDISERRARALYGRAVADAPPRSHP
jgi:hypothetical protein